jgi:hypothetical protein
MTRSTVIIIWVIIPAVHCTDTHARLRILCSVLDTTCAFPWGIGKRIAVKTRNVAVILAAEWIIAWLTVMLVHTRTIKVALPTTPTSILCMHIIVLTV